MLRRHLFFEVILTLALAVSTIERGHLFLKVGNGSFQNPVGFEAEGSTRSICCADLNQDVDYD